MKNNQKTINPSAKGGFQDNPQNINRNGRPPKGYSITEMMKEMLNNDPERKRELGEVIYQKALSGDITAIKTVWQYMDGMPKQENEVKITDLTGLINLK